MDAIDSMRSSAPWGIEDAAARSSAELKEPRRVLPEIPMMLIGGMLLGLRGQVEDDDLRVPTAGERDVARAGLERVPGPERVAIRGDVAASDVHIAEPSVADGALRARFAVEEARVEKRILAHQQRALAAVWRSDEPQAAALLARRIRLLLVRGCDAFAVRLDPDLQEVGDAGRVGVVLAVPHAGAGAHALHVARHDDRGVAHRVLVRERPGEHVAHDFHVAMGMRAEAGPGLHAVLVDHDERAVAGMPRVVIVGERERVIALEPAVLRMAALGGAPDLKPTFAEHRVPP